MISSTTPAIRTPDQSWPLAACDGRESLTALQMTVRTPSILKTPTAPISLHPSTAIQGPDDFMASVEVDKHDRGPVSSTGETLSMNTGMAVRIWPPPIVLEVAGRRETPLGGSSGYPGAEICRRYSAWLRFLSD